MEKVLVLYGSYGGGHKSAANAVKQYIDENYKDKEVVMLDCVECSNKIVNKITVGAYNKITKSAPWLWKRIYFSSEKGLLAKISNLTNKLMTHKFYKMIEKEKPSTIICTHMFASQMCGILKRKGKITCKVSTILTDFETHNQWLQEHEYIDNFFVAHGGMKKVMVEKGIDENKIHCFGIPISGRFLESFNREEILKAFKLKDNKKTIVFFGGGEMGLGQKRTCQILEVLASIFNNVQIIAISGKNEEMKKAFNEIVERTNSKHRIVVLDFTNKVPEIMSIADLVISKPGGLTTSESLASGLPMLIINPLPGQEEQNARFLEKNGAGVWLEKEYDIETVLREVILNDEKLENMSKSAKHLAKKDSTQKICEKIFE